MIDDDIQEDEYNEEDDRDIYEAKLQTFAESLLKTRAEAIEFRASCGVERRWRLSEKLYDFASEETQPSMMDYVSGEATVKRNGPKRSRVTMNIIRGRCETAEGRFSDTMLPVDGKNWGLKVTPNPEMEGMQDDPRPAMQAGQNITDQNGNAVPMATVVQDLRTRAEKAMGLMEREVEDQLTECDYNGECRDMIHKAVKLGTGILKGPSVVKSSKRKWKRETEIDEYGEETAVYVVQTSEDNQPASKSLDPWNVFPSPDCREDVRRASYIWERDTIRPREVRDLIGLPDYNEEQLMRVLEEAPIRNSVSSNNRSSSYQTHAENINRGGMYEIWEYHGDVSKEDMELLGCECPNHKSVSACVVFINDRPVKAKLNTLDTGELPYVFFQWTKVSDEPWGIGIPYILMWTQRVIDAGWRATMDNAGDSAGSNVVIMGLEPADGRRELGGKKLWVPDGETEIDDVRKCFAQFQITNNQEPLQRIIEMALRFADLETSTPAIFQGEAQEVPETLGATNIVVDSSNISLRNRIKRYDDCVTRPHLRMYYDFNMQYSPKQEIKGDFDVDALGVKVLYEKDQQTQMLLQVFQLKGDPDIARRTDWDKAIEMFYAGRRLDILKDEAKIKEDEAQVQAQPVANPALEVAQVRVEGELEKAKLVQGSDMAELKFKAEQADLDRQHQARMKQMDLEIKMMEYSEKRNIKLDELKTQLALGAQGMNLQRELSDKKAAVPEVSTPPTEPIGKAPVGQSYAA
jgi:hypothetical protein